MRLDGLVDAHGVASVGGRMGGERLHQVGRDFAALHRREDDVRLDEDDEFGALLDLFRAAEEPAEQGIEPSTGVRQ